MKTVLLILGAAHANGAKGEFNTSLFNAARDHLASHYTVLTTVVEEGYDVSDEINKFKQADIIIYQYPIYWYMMPALFKHYIDDVFAMDEFYTINGSPYGSTGLLNNKQFLISTTWTAPKTSFDNKSSFFDGYSVDEMLLPMRKTNEFCGLKELPHFASFITKDKECFEQEKTRFLAHLDKTLLA